MLLAEAAQEDALALVDRIGELVGQVEVREAADLKLMASGGIATWEEDDTVNDLMAYAREALDLAIAEGGDCFAGYLVPQETLTSASASGRDQCCSAMEANMATWLSSALSAGT